jgi:hypothetical protein
MSKHEQRKLPVVKEAEFFTADDVQCALELLVRDFGGTLKERNQFWNDKVVALGSSSGKKHQKVGSFGYLKKNWSYKVYQRLFLSHFTVT